MNNIEKPLENTIQNHSEFHREVHELHNYNSNDEIVEFMQH
jgi:hypothetical protein